MTELEESGNAADEYVQNRQNQDVAANSASFLDWLNAQPGVLPDEGSAFDVPPPEKPSAVGTAMRNVAEIPRQIVGGIDDAGRHALQLLNPLTDWLNENVADLRYDPVSAPKTTTGRVTRSASQFLSGFIPAMKGMRALGLGATASSFAAGAIADFSVRDPHEKRLSDLWQDANLPENVLTDYLASDPNDSDAEGRFKNALEGAVTGGMLEGVLHGARALRAAKWANKAKGKTAAEVATQQAREQYGEVTEEVSKRVLGDPAKPLVITSKLAASGKATGSVKPLDVTKAVEPGKDDVFINFARIDTPDAVKDVIDTMAQRFSGSVKEAQRGVISQRETVKLAEQMGMDVGTLLSRRQGMPFNAEQAVAARKLWAASADNLLTLAKQAADPNAGAVDQFAFRKALATHHAIQAEVIGARTETARALASWRIPVGGGVEQAKAIQELVTASGGSGMSTDLAKRLVILAEHGDPKAMGRFVEKAWGANTFDAVREVWINGLLSSPSTHVVNVASNSAVAFQQMYERGAASLIGELRGGADTVAPGEALAMAHGLKEGLKDAFRLAWKALKTGETGASLGKVDLPQKGAIAAETWRIGSETALGRTVDFVGSAFRVPSRLLGAEDEFFKTIGYRMELHAQALRQATEEGLSGKEFAKRMADIVANPPEFIRIRAADSALYSTFSNQPGAVGQAFLKLRERIPVSTFVLPFIKTPVNIARYTFERTPFAPLVGQWRADIIAGGARADIAMARMATGTAVMLTALDYADSGLISGAGPEDSGQREAMTRQGWQPYSARVGNRWYSFSRADPFGSLLGFSADVAEKVRNGELNEDDVDEWQEVMAMGITAVSQTAINKTYLKGVASFVEVMQDPSRYSESYVNSMLASFVPYTSLMGSIERAADPVVRDAVGPWEVVNAKLAGLSSQLPARRNLWGEEIRAESGLGKTYDFFSPVQSREIKPTPIDKEIMRLAPIGAADNVDGAAPQRIGKRSYFQGVQVNFKEYPKVYERYVQLAGNELPHPAFKLGAKDLLNEIVSGRHSLSAVYKIRSDPMKLAFIKTIIDQYRTLAQQQVMQEFPEFAAYVNDLKTEKMNSRLPVLE